MKLLLCLNCCDVVKLSRNPRECECGKSGGRYSLDELTAVYWGKYTFPLGIGNNLLVHLVQSASTQKYEGRIESIIQAEFNHAAETRGLFAISKRAKTVRCFNRKTAALKWLTGWNERIPGIRKEEDTL